MVLVSCHWFTDDKSLTLLLRCLRKYLLIFPISLFAALINRHFGSELKFGLLSFEEMNAFDFARHSNLSETAQLFAIVLASL